MSTVAGQGCVAFLIDESAAMSVAMGEVVTDGKASARSNADRVATALNSLLGKWSKTSDFDVAVIGYKSDASGQVSVGGRWGGALAGREFVSLAEVAAAPLRIETRTRKLPAPGGFGVAREETVDFPVWYEPVLGVRAPQIAAYDYCAEAIERWLAGAGPSPGAPVVVHVFSGASGDGNPQKAIEKLMAMSTPAGNPLLFQVHVAGSAATTSSLYPSSHIYLTLGSARDLFRRASPLPLQMISALREANVVAHAGARGLLYNAKIAEVIRLFNVLPAYTKEWPLRLPPAPPAPAPVPLVMESAGFAPLSMSDAPAFVSLPGFDATAPVPGFDAPLVVEATAAPPTMDAGVAAPPTAPACTEKAALVVFVLDRSVEDPYSGNMLNSCAKLQDYANDYLRQVANVKEGTVEAAMISYGLDPAGQVEVRETFDGPLSGRTTVPHTELMAGALRVDEIEEEISNGIGGIIKVTRKKPVFFDLEPTGDAPASAALAAAARIADEWSAAHALACVPPIIVHLTRGRADVTELEQAAAPVRALCAAAGPAVLYHQVVTEKLHKSVAYPDSDAAIEDPSVKKLWELTSPLMGCARLAADRPILKPQSRGMVINSKFDLLLDGVKQRMES